MIPELSQTGFGTVARHCPARPTLSKRVGTRERERECNGNIFLGCVIIFSRSKANEREFKQKPFLFP